VAAAAVGGAVGGSLAAKSPHESKKTNSSPSSTSHIEQASWSTPTPTSALRNTAITTTTLVGPSATLLRDCPSSNNTLYAVPLGSMQFRKTCENSYVNANGYDFSVVRWIPSLNECIDACTAWNTKNRAGIQKGSTRICNAVCWRNSVKEQGVCYGYTTQNLTGTGFRYSTPAEKRCDGAALINQDF
jgi:hypothetical protein